MNESHFNFQHTKISNSLKLGCAPEFVGILEQGFWGQIYSSLEAIDILLSNIFVVLYANNYNNYDRSSEF